MDEHQQARRRWYTAAEAADMLGISRATATKRCQRGTWPVRSASPGRGRPYQVLGSFVRSELLKMQGG